MKDRQAESPKEELTDEAAYEFEKLCKPLNDWLQRNYHPHCKIIIENDHAEIVESVMGVPFKVLD